VIRRVLTAVGFRLAQVIGRPFELDGLPLNLSFDQDELLDQLLSKGTASAP
jgi:hypothetical protein